MLRISCLLTLACLLTSSGTASETVRHIQYTGALSQPSSGGEDLILRRFRITLLRSSAAFFFVEDDVAEGCPWPESFGRLDAPESPQPRLVYHFDGGVYTLPLPPLVIDPANLQSGDSWQADDWTFEPGDEQKVGDTVGRRIFASERRGRRLTLVAAADTGDLLTAEQDVFMGQGQKFRLTVQRVSIQKPSEGTVADLERLQTELLALQSALKRRTDVQSPSLTPRQIDETQSRLTTLTDLSSGTPLHELTERISRDVRLQQQRLSATMNRQKELVGAAAPDFSLNLVTGGSLTSTSLRGGATVLHFWNYDDERLSEPYGQVGYLEFLSGQLGDHARIIGISTNPVLQQPDGIRRGQRAARKLIEFMNITYPVGYDDGSLLRKLGDPRESGGELPLWVVLDADGAVIHYHAGYYEVDRREGLRQLKEIVSGRRQTP